MQQTYGSSGHDPQQTFGIAACITARSQHRPQTALGLGDRTFDVPTMSVNPRVKSPFHLSPVAGFRSSPPVPTSIELDHRAANARFLAGRTVIVLPVVTRVTEQTINRQMATGLPDRLWKLRRVLTRSVADHGPGKQVRRCMTNHGQFLPAVTKESFVSDTTNVVAGGVSTFQPGGADHRFRLVVNQAASSGFAKTIRTNKCRWVTASLRPKRGSRLPRRTYEFAAGRLLRARGAHFQMRASRRSD